MQYKSSGLFKITNLKTKTECERYGFYWSSDNDVGFCNYYDGNMRFVIDGTTLVGGTQTPVRGYGYVEAGKLVLLITQHPCMGLNDEQCAITPTSNCEYNIYWEKNEPSQQPPTGGVVEPPETPSQGTNWTLVLIVAGIGIIVLIIIGVIKRK
jgi:hypothetical protein